jgi:uncharacterized protein (DUF1697 family)
MPRFIALLRAVNVGGTGLLPMTELRSICHAAGFARIETYLASGNVVFESEADASKVKRELEARLLAHTGKPVAVVVRTEAEMMAVRKANPFSALDPKHAYAIFLDDQPQEDALADAVGHCDEAISAIG